MAKIACSLLKNKADLCLKIQRKLLLGWGSKEGIYMLWNEWHACTNSRRPDISKVSDRAVYTALFPLRIQRFLPWQGLKDPWREDEVGSGGWQGKSKMSKVTVCVWCFFLFLPRLPFLCFVSLCCFSNHCSLNSVVRNFLFTFYYNGLFKMIDRSLSWPKTRLALNVEKKSDK